MLFRQLLQSGPCRPFPRLVVAAFFSNPGFNLQPGFLDPFVNNHTACSWHPPMVKRIQYHSHRACASRAQSPCWPDLEKADRRLSSPRHRLYRRYQFVIEDMQGLLQGSGKRLPQNDDVVRHLQCTLVCRCSEKGRLITNWTDASCNMISTYDSIAKDRGVNSSGVSRVVLIPRYLQSNDLIREMESE